MQKITKCGGRVPVWVIVVYFQPAALVRGRLHPCLGVGEDVVQKSCGDAHGALVVDEVDELKVRSVRWPVSAEMNTVGA